MKPLCVDLDGTLIKGDALWEQTVFLLRQKPAILLQMAGWLLRGKAFFKDRMARLPFPPFGPGLFNDEIVEWLRGEAQVGRSVYLVTASHEPAAQAAAMHSRCFSGVICSTANVNLGGARKAAALVERFGAGGFDYAGNSGVDLPVWNASSLAIAVRARPSVLTRLRRLHPAMQVRQPLPQIARTAWRALRPQQLLKNLLLFVPLILAHRASDFPALVRSALGFASFSAAAASAYCVNDLLDVAADRLDPRKSLRPIAAGELSPAGGVALAGVMLGLAVAFCVPLSGSFQLALLGYLVATPLYSLFLKRQVGADALVLTGLYVLRVLAGGLAAGVIVSQWLLTFSLFFFLSLSLVKRYGELLSWVGRIDDCARLPGRGYELRDREGIRAFGAASGYVSVLVFILYVNSPGTQTLYPMPEILWLIGPLLAFWLNRLWLLAGRGEIKGDPIPFIARDWVSWATLGAASCLVLAAALFRHAP